MPATLHLTYQLDRPAPDDPTLALHAVLYGLIGNADPQLAQRLHGAQLSPLSQHTARHSGFGGVLAGDARTVQLRLNCLDDSLMELLRDATTTGLPLPGVDGARLTGVIVGQSLSQWSYESLLDTPADEAQLTFLTPTALRSGEQTCAEPRPTLIYHGLLRRWNAYSPRPFGREVWAVLSDDLRLLHHQTRTVVLNVPGSRGRASLRAFTGDAGVAVARARSAPALAALSRLVPFAGIGSKTVYGFGAAVSETRWSDGGSGFTFSGGLT